MIILETSGIADSKKNQGHLWVQEDSGNPTQIYLLKKDGTVMKKVYIENVVNRDWEDMVLADNDLYIGDIGDNRRIYPQYTIYKFREPDGATDTVRKVETIRFQYPDGSHDSEAFLVDPATKDIYLITKRNKPSRIYKLTFPYSTKALNKAELVAILNYSGVVSAALSPDAREIILKTYTGLHYYTRQENETIEAALVKKYKRIPYRIEAQGEAVTFASDSSGFYTLSEKGIARNVKLYFYQKLR